MTQTLFYIIPTIAIVLYVSTGFVVPEGYDEYYICPTYETKNIGDEFETQYYSHSQYNLEHNKKILQQENKEGAYISEATQKYSFSLKMNEETLGIDFINNNTGNNVNLSDYPFYDYLLIENKDSYVIMIQNDYNKVLYGIYKKSEISDEPQYLENIKNQLKEYVVPEINQIGSITFGNSDYKYAQIQTIIYDRLYFDENGTLYIAE